MKWVSATTVWDYERWGRALRSPASAREQQATLPHYVNYTGVLVGLSRVSRSVLRDWLGMAYKLVTRQPKPASRKTNAVDFLLQGYARALFSNTHTPPHGLAGLRPAGSGNSESSRMPKDSRFNFAAVCKTDRASTLFQP